MKQAQHKDAFFGRAGQIKPKAAITDNECHNDMYEIALSSQILLKKKKSHLTPLPTEMDLSCATYLSQEEQIISMEQEKCFRKLQTR